MSEKPMLKERLLTVLTKKTWLIPILYQIYSYGAIKYDELKQLLNIRGSLLKRALWWLVKYGIIEKYYNEFRISVNYKSILEEVFLNKCIVRNYYVFKIGKTFIIAIIRRTRISAFTVPAQFIEKLSKLEANVETRFTTKDLMDVLGISAKLAYRVIKTHEILKQCSS